MSTVAEPNQSGSSDGTEFMRRAIEIARRGMAAGEPPIGACIVRNGRVVGLCHNAVVSELDITAHAEIMAIRQACQSERALELGGSQLFTTVEPCPMCRAACHYAGIDAIIYGASLEDMDALTGNEMMAPRVDAASSDGPCMHGDFMRNECLALLHEWAAPA